MLPQTFWFRYSQAKLFFKKKLLISSQIHYIYFVGFLVFVKFSNNLLQSNFQPRSQAESQVYDAMQ